MFASWCTRTKRYRIRKTMWRLFDVLVLPSTKLISSALFWDNLAVKHQYIFLRAHDSVCGLPYTVIQESIFLELFPVLEGISGLVGNCWTNFIKSDLYYLVLSRTRLYFAASAFSISASCNLFRIRRGLSFKKPIMMFNNRKLCVSSIPNPFILLYFYFVFYCSLKPFCLDVRLKKIIK